MEANDEARIRRRTSRRSSMIFSANQGEWIVGNN